MHKNSVELLNKGVADEMLAIHQYMYFHFHCDDQGYDLLAGLFKKTAIEEMGHVEALSERILFLKGDVEMKVGGDVQQIHDPKEMVKCAAQMENESARDYNLWAIECSKNADSFDTEMANMEKFGEQYLALQSIERSKIISATTGQK